MATVMPAKPPQVNYRLTPLGVSLWTPVGALGVWARAHRAEIERAQREFDGRTVPVPVPA